MKTPLNPLGPDRIQEMLNTGKLDQVRSRDASKHKSRSKRRNITVLGDSLLKSIEQYRMNINSLGGDNKIFINSFNGDNISDMNDYVIPSLKYNPEIQIMHAGGNDLRNEKSPEAIANDIITLGTKMKSNENDVIISGIICRRYKFDIKGLLVNNFLKVKCRESSLGFLYYD